MIEVTEYHPYYDEEVVILLSDDGNRQAIYAPSAGEWELMVPFGKASWNANPFGFSRKELKAMPPITESEAREFVQNGTFRGKKIK